MAKTKIRKPDDTSFLAEHINYTMKAEFEKNGVSSRYSCLNTLLAIVREADNKENNNISYDNGSIIIRDIPGLSPIYGTDFTRENMRRRLTGLAERYKNMDGEYIVTVYTTHDLNSAVIRSISDLLFEMKA